MQQSKSDINMIPEIKTDGFLRNSRTSHVALRAPQRHGSKRELTSTIGFVNLSFWPDTLIDLSNSVHISVSDVADIATKTQILIIPMKGLTVMTAFCTNIVSACGVRRRRTRRLVNLSFWPDTLIDLRNSVHTSDRVYDHCDFVGDEEDEEEGQNKDRER